jgi:Right handed beta helix region
VAGNLITRNAQAGVNSGLASSIFLGASEISWNGTGVIVVGAALSVVGGNTIVDNSSSGVAGFRSASITVGDSGIGIDTWNTISRNGKADGAGGVFAFQGSTAIVRNALVSENRGFGVGFNLRSAGQIVGSTITGNDGDGIRMAFGGGLFVGPPASTVSGNGAWGLNCGDGESSYVNGVFLNVSGNGAGTFAPSCTAF